MKKLVKTKNILFLFFLSIAFFCTAQVASITGIQPDSLAQACVSNGKWLTMKINFTDDEFKPQSPDWVYYAYGFEASLDGKEWNQVSFDGLPYIIYCNAKPIIKRYSDLYFENTLYLDVFPYYFANDNFFNKLKQSDLDIFIRLYCMVSAPDRQSMFDSYYSDPISINMKQLKEEDALAIDYIKTRIEESPSLLYLASNNQYRINDLEGEINTLIQLIDRFPNSDIALFSKAATIHGYIDPGQRYNHQPYLDIAKAYLKEVKESKIAMVKNLYESYYSLFEIPE